ncbi:hypothetical protein Tco_0916787 [Tanacetum coccineum]
MISTLDVVVVSFGQWRGLGLPRWNLAAYEVGPQELWFVLQAHTNVPFTTIVEPPLLSITILPPPPTPLITDLQQTPVPTLATVLSSSLQDLPNFGSLFGFDHRLKTLETDFFEFKQTNQFVATVSLIPDIIDAYLANKMHEAIKIAVQLQSDRLRDEAQAKNEDFINKLDENIKKIIKDHVKEQVNTQVSKILTKIEKTVNEQLEAEVLTRSSNESKTSYAVAANLSKLELKKILIDKMESNKSIHKFDEQKILTKALLKTKKPSLDQIGGPRKKSGNEQLFRVYQCTKGKDLQDIWQEFETGVTEDQSNEETFQHPDWFQKPTKPSTPNRDWKKTLPDAHGPVQHWLSSLAHKEDPRESFNELMDTPLDFSAFVMNRLKVDTLTPELLTGPTFELMKGSCKSLVELEYLFEEVYKATTEQLDWNNPEGQQYPHDLRKPLPLIPNSRGRRVIPFDHFINNDLEYLSGGVSSRKYATSVTKTKAADYGHIKWIEDLVPNRMWSQVPVSYDKHALWGISHWGRKRQQFYGFAANRESARDVYSKRRIIAVTKLEIVDWHNYKHLDWITVRRDDDKLYKFKEGDFNRLRIQDIEDMLLLLVQGKLTNLTVEECLAFNNKDKKNRLMRIDELHKFCDGTLNDVRTALNDRLKGIRMKYLPQTIWRQSDRDKARAMIQAIDKQLKTRRIMQSLEKFIGGRPYEGDFRLLQRTI